MHASNIVQEMDRVIPKLQREGWRLEEPRAHVNRWTAPSGQTVHTFTTRTDPRFAFAYTPLDNDSDRIGSVRALNLALEASEPPMGPVRAPAQRWVLLSVLLPPL